MERVNLEGLPKGTLVELARMYARNWQTLDGLWFRNVEAEYGLEAAVKLDLKNWQKQAAIEAERIMKILKINKGELSTIPPSAAILVLIVCLCRDLGHYN